MAEKSPVPSLQLYAFTQDELVRMFDAHLASLQEGIAKCEAALAKEPEAELDHMAAGTGIKTHREALQGAIHNLRYQHIERKYLRDHVSLPEGHRMTAAEVVALRDVLRPVEVNPEAVRFAPDVDMPNHAERRLKETMVQIPRLVLPSQFMAKGD